MFLEICFRNISFRALGQKGLRTVVKPVPEAIEAFLHQEFGGAKVEPRID